MKSSNKILSLFLVLLMIFSMLSLLPASARVNDDSIISGDFSYTINEDGTATITATTAPGDTLTLPSTIDEHPVSVVGAYFCNAAPYKKVIIPEGIKHIDTYAFARGENLEEVILPEGLESIDYFAFAYNKKLKAIEIPSTVTTIEGQAFYECGLESVVVPDSVTYLGNQVFCKCSNLEEVTLSKNLTYIGGHLLDETPFADNPENKENGLLYINNYLLRADMNLTGEVTVKEGITLLAKSVFIGCKDITSVSLPHGISAIPEQTFYNCTSLKSVNIPETVTEIGNLAFYNCDSLDQVIIPEHVKTIGSSLFQNCDGLKRVSWPEHLTTIPYQTFNECHNLEYIFIPETVTAIHGYAFMSCENLKSLTVPESVEHIGYGAGFYETLVHDDYGMPCILVSGVYGFTVKGFKGSAAESFAEEHSFNFKELTHSEILGDVDLDGELSVKDATLLQKHISHIEIPYEEQLSLSDFDETGEISIKDATAIQKAAANITDLSALPPVAEGYSRYFFYLPLFWENDFSNGAGVYYEGGAAFPGLACTPTGYQTKHGKVYYCDLPETVTTFCFNNMVDGGEISGSEIYCAELKTFDIEAREEGMIFVLDTQKIVTNIYTGKNIYDGYWFYYYGNGEYGETPEKGVFVYSEPALNWICTDCTDLFG